MPTNSPHSPVPSGGNRDGYYTEEAVPFFRSRKNKVGVAAAVGIGALQLATGGLGLLWPVVAACGWAAGALLTPAKKVYVPPAPPSSPHELKSRMNVLRKKLESQRVPEPVRTAFDQMRTQAAWVLQNFNRLDSAPSQQSMVRSIIDEHAVGLVEAYLDVTNPAEASAQNAFIESIDLLTGELTEIREAIEQDSVRHLVDHNIALKLQFGDTLPPAGGQGAV
ncbi:hypothetical protein [uncultured Corynebacterium sp.]|uniref:hypothetical protein n=1 Tax=uncultured Corynebacterium sp. TaxID=159447 RepID=UPI0025E812A3|nr:hypothetical protein [uncultured Corynebacterium sp.]